MSSQNEIFSGHPFLEPCGEYLLRRDRNGNEIARFHYQAKISSCTLPDGSHLSRPSTGNFYLAKSTGEAFAIAYSKERSAWEVLATYCMGLREGNTITNKHILNDLSRNYKTTRKDVPIPLRTTGSTQHLKEDCFEVPGLEIFGNSSVRVDEDQFLPFVDDIVTETDRLKIVKVKRNLDVNVAITSKATGRRYRYLLLHNPEGGQDGVNGLTDYSCFQQYVYPKPLELTNIRDWRFAPEYAAGGLLTLSVIGCALWGLLALFDIPANKVGGLVADFWFLTGVLGFCLSPAVLLAVFYILVPIAYADESSGSFFSATIGPAELHYKRGLTLDGCRYPIGSVFNTIHRGMQAISSDCNVGLKIECGDSSRKFDFSGGQVTPIDFSCNERDLRYTSVYDPHDPFCMFEPSCLDGRFHEEFYAGEVGYVKPGYRGGNFVQKQDVGGVCLHANGDISICGNVIGLNEQLVQVNMNNAFVSKCYCQTREQWFVRIVSYQELHAWFFCYRDEDDSASWDKVVYKQRSGLDSTLPPRSMEAA